MNKKNIHLVCMVFTISIGIYSVSGISDNLVPGFILFFLLYLLNMQVRYLFLKGKMYLLSIIIEFVMAGLIGTSFGGLSHLLTLITMTSGIVNMEKYHYGISILAFAFQLYLLKDRNMDYILLNVFVFISIWILLMTIIGCSKQVRELEYLYDDIRRYSYELENTKKQVESYSKRVEELAQLEERNRISEEIHDSIGHRLTALLIQMEAGIRVMDFDTLKGRELISEARDNLRESIEVLRDTVRGIKPREYRSFHASLEDLTEEFKRRTGIRVGLSFFGNPVKLYPGVEMVLYRNIQEALTNSVKHGDPDYIEVILKYGENSVTLTVRDNGRGCTEIKKGMGISGMEERTAFIGGSINFYSGEGFTIECIVPVNSSC